MATTRRNFLKYTAITISGGIVLWRNWYAWILAPMRTVYRKMTSSTFDSPNTGELTSKTRKDLLFVTETLVGGSIEKNHYEMYFDWRAENLPGHKNLYDKFIATLDQVSRKKFNKDFIDCDIKQRKLVLKPIFPLERSSTFRKVLFNKPEYQLFYNRIIREILKLYSRTDAWILLGYKYWPGDARGLELYTKKIL